MHRLLKQTALSLLTLIIILVAINQFNTQLDNPFSAIFYAVVASSVVLGIYYAASLAAIYILMRMGGLKRYAYFIAPAIPLVMWCFSSIALIGTNINSVIVSFFISMLITYLVITYGYFKALALLSKEHHHKH